MTLKILWMIKSGVSPVFIISQFGWCKTFNVVGFDQMFNLNSTAGYFQYKSNVNSSDINLKPYSLKSTVKKEFGYQGYLSFPDDDLEYCFYSARCITDGLQSIVIVHSPYEMPDIKHRKFALRYFELSKLAIEPMIKITDETLLDTDVNE